MRRLWSKKKKKGKFFNRKEPTWPREKRFPVTNVTLDLSILNHGKKERKRTTSGNTNSPVLLAVPIRFAKYKFEI
jgi:hypothetical protein